MCSALVCAGAWFVQLEFMQLLFALLTLFAVPSMYFIAWVRMQLSAWRCPAA